MGLFDRETFKKELQKFWDCKDCKNKSRKLRNLRHESGCPANRVSYNNRIPRMCYFGHHLIASIDGYEDGEALWKCYSCSSIWFAWDGETCPVCGSVNRTYGSNPVYAKKSPDFTTDCDWNKIQHLFPKKAFVRRQNLDENNNYVSDFDRGHAKDAYEAFKRGEFRTCEEAFLAKNNSKRRSLAIAAAKKWIANLKPEEYAELIQDPKYRKCNNQLSAYDEAIFSQFLPQFADIVWLTPSMLNSSRKK